MSRKEFIKKFNQFQSPPSLCDQENTVGLSREISLFLALSECLSGGQKPRVCPVIKISSFTNYYWTKLFVYFV